jgi:hypothetical protein
MLMIPEFSPTFLGVNGATELKVIKVFRLTGRRSGILFGGKEHLVSINAVTQPQPMYSAPIVWL